MMGSLKKAAGVPRVKEQPAGQAAVKLRAGQATRVPNLVQAATIKVDLNPINENLAWGVEEIELFRYLSQPSLYPSGMMLVAKRPTLFLPPKSDLLKPRTLG